MDKEQILDLFEVFFNSNDRDSGYLTVAPIELAKSLYPDNKSSFLLILKDWLKEYENPSRQFLALSIISEIKIKELLEEVYKLRTEIEKTRKPPFLKDDLKDINRIISILEGYNQ